MTYSHHIRKNLEKKANQNKRQVGKYDIKKIKNGKE